MHICLRHRRCRRAIAPCLPPLDQSSDRANAAGSESRFYGFAFCSLSNSASRVAPGSQCVDGARPASLFALHLVPLAKFLKYSFLLDLVAGRRAYRHRSCTRRIDGRYRLLLGPVGVKPCLRRSAPLPAPQLRAQIHVMPFGMTALTRNNVGELSEKSLSEFVDASHPLGSCSPVIGNQHYPDRDRILLVIDSEQSGIVVPRKSCGQ